ncbi:MAG: AsmA-like C-terminal domain-containing protein [Pseudomonadota bacterium]
MVGLGVVVVGLLVRLAVAPLHVPATGWAASALANAAGMPVRVGAVGVRLELSGVALALRDVRLKSDVFSASIGTISVLQGLFGRSLRFDDAALRLDPSRGSGEPVPIPHPDTAIEALDKALQSILDQTRSQGVRSVAIRNGRLDIVSAGRPINEARVFQNVEADLDVSGRTAFAASVAMIGAEGPLSASIGRTVEDGVTAIRIALDGISPKDLVRAGPVRAGFRVEALVDARLRQGTVEAASLDLAVSEGTVVFGLDPARVMDAASLRLTRLPDGTARVDRFVLVAGNSTVGVTGTITPAQDVGVPWTFDLATDEALFDPPGNDVAPVIAKSVTATGNIDFAQRLLNIETFVLSLPDGRFDAVATFDFSPQGPTLAGAARIGPSSVPALLAVWPPVVAHGPRKAISETVLGGVVKGGELVFALTPLELDGDPATNDMIEGGLSIDIAFQGATVTTPELPIAVQRAAGFMRLRDKTLSVRLDKGTVPAGEGRALAVNSGAMTIRDLSQQPPNARLSGEVEAPLSAVVLLAERFDVPQLKNTPIGPDDVSGTVLANVGLRTPLAPNTPDSAREWSVDARLTDASSKVPIAGQTFTEANIEVLINRRRIAARGRARIDGLKVDVNYSEIFDGAKSGAARFVLTDRDRAIRGFSTGDMLEGPVVITLEAQDDGTRAFEADLTQAQVSLPVFQKAEGRRLMATGTVEGDPPALTVSNLRIDGRGGVAGEGELVIEDGELARAVLTGLALSEGDAATLTVDRDGKAYSVTFDAARFDGRDLIRRMRSGGSGGDGARKGSVPPLALDIAAESVRLTDENTLADLRVRARHDGEQVTRLSASGRLDDVNAGSFAVELKPAVNNTRRLQADISGLGRVLSALGIYRRMRGGRTTIDARMDADGVVAGRLTANDFVLADEKSLENILVRARAQPGQRLNEAGQPLGTQPAAAIDGMSFDRLTVEFTKRGDTISIGEAILRGPILGGTANGAINLKSRTVLINGTLIPAYGVNNLFGRVPLVGEILGGGNKGGLIGVTFRLAGPLDNPQLVVNPMSAIAPGIFRRIFEFR